MFEVPGTRHEFQVIRLWEQPPEVFLANPGLLPFAVLVEFEQKVALLCQVATQIDAIPGVSI